jgi:outer membrane protein N
MLPEFGGDSYSKADNFMTNRANGVATYRNADMFGMVEGLNFALQYQGNNEGSGNGNEGTNNGRDIRHENGDGFGISTTYDLGMGFSAGAAYTTSAAGTARPGRRLSPSKTITTRRPSSTP